MAYLYLLNLFSSVYYLCRVLSLPVELFTLRSTRLKEQKEKLYKNIAIAFAVGLVVMVGIVVAVISNSPKEELHTHIDINANGDVVIPTSDVVDGLNYYDYGGPQDLLVLRDDSGIFRTAYDVCEECFSTGTAHYTLLNELLTCQSFSNTFPVADLGSASWGGCQPVSIPLEYRKDTDSEIVIPSDVLTYAVNVFDTWQNNDFTATLESYVPSPE